MAQPRYDINNKPMDPDAGELGTQEYFFQFYVDKIEMYCKCPECGTQYCYSTMKEDTDTVMLAKTIKELHQFYYQEFEYFCPDRPTHDIKYAMTDRRVHEWEDDMEELWAKCSLR